MTVLLKKIITSSLEKLKKEKSIPKNVKINENTILLGDNSICDSIAFVTFLTYCEEEIKIKFKQNFVIKMNEIHDLNEGKHALKIKDFISALNRLLKK